MTSESGALLEIRNLKKHFRVGGGMFGAMTGKKDPAYWQVFEYACHETNYGLSNILSVARNLEKRGDSK